MNDKLQELERCFNIIDEAYRTKNINVCEGCRFQHCATCGNCIERLENCKEQIKKYRKSA